MFIGHFALGFAAKRAAPEVSLGTLFLAAQFVDLLWPTLLLLGIERVEIDPALSGAPLVFVHYPFSHSLLGALGWGALLTAAYFAVTRRRRGAAVVSLLVVSHWVLDLLVHRPDLPLLFAGGPTLGLGLWNLPIAAQALEIALFVACFAVYLRTPAGRSAGLKPWVLAALLVAIQLGNALGPPPPSMEAVAWVGQAQWLLVAAGYWADRPRRGRRERGPGAATATGPVG
jgi:membrane-bound metal-dependent hydrolase YbcI (DUF457 family)